MHCLTQIDLCDLKRFAEEDIEYDAWALDHSVLLSMHTVRMGYDQEGSIPYVDLLFPEPVYRVLFPDKHYIPNPPKLSHRILQMVAYLRRRSCTRTGNDSA